MMGRTAISILAAASAVWAFAQTPQTADTANSSLAPTSDSCDSIACSRSMDAALTPEPAAANRVKFCWGAEIGGSVDMSGHDMSSIDFNLAFGLKYKWVKMFGLGAGTHIMVSNPCRTFPVYCDFKTDFSRRQNLLFLSLKGGAALNYYEDNAHSTGAYASGALGVNFARSSKFTSYMTVGYTFIQRPDIHEAEIAHPDVHMATIRLGITF